jgi:signal transduction histidine kinase/DNA-binding response OmpR family regulator/HPt (histidine-containing phosphotransfer) domain-containing protein
MSVRARSIAAIIAVSMIIIIVAISVGLAFNQFHLVQTIERDISAVADTADRLISSEIGLLKANVATAAWYIQAALAEEKSSVLHKALEVQNNLYPGFWALTLIESTDGENHFRILDSVGTPPVHPDFISSEYVRTALEGEAVISTSRVDPASEKLVFHVCVPMAENRVLIATIDGMYFSDLLAGLTIWETGHIFIDDGEGYILANPRDEWVQKRFNFIKMAESDPQYQSIAATVRKMIRGERGVSRFFVGGIERFCAYRPITDSKAGWSLGVIAPVNESPINSSRQGFVIVGLVCVALCVMFAFIASGFLEKPYTTIRKMIHEMEHQETLLHTVNQTAEILLRSDSAHFAADLYRCMGMMARSVNADRMRIFQHVDDEGHVAANLIHEWLKDEPDGRELTQVFFRYDEYAPRWHEKFSAAQCINSIVRNLPPQEQAMLALHGILSILIVPLFFRNRLWGFASFDDCREERLFSLDEEGLMSSGGLLFVNAHERNEMEKDLIRAQEEAVASAEAKSSFLANMSHEMRTPLNAIIGLSQLTLESGRLEDEEDENIGKVYNSAITLLGLINDILDLSKIESGKFEIIPVEYDTPSLINDTVTLNSVRIGSRPITFQLHIDENLPNLLKGDDLRIKQMFNNLLSNAFKYTREGQVDWTLTCERDEDGLWLISTVKDTGIGIRPEDLKKLFSDYNQVDTKSNRKIEGTGLGLAITRRMAEMMGGSITVESEYGLGTTFTMKIRQESAGSNVIGPEVAAKLCHFSYSDHKRDRSAKLVRAYIPYARILIVDDVSINLDVARGLLRPYGMKVDCVMSGPDAIRLIREEKVKYNAVFMDHMMPGMDGIEAVRIIREEIGTEYAKNVPIIALTANAIVGNEEMFLSKGFQAFLSKPIDIMAMDTAINRWVRDKTLEKELTEQRGADMRSGTDRRKKDRRRSTDRRQNRAQPPAAQTAAETPAFLEMDQWDAHGVDFHRGLEHFGGDMESYIRVLKSYVKNTPGLLDQIRACTEEGLDNYRIVVHGIKSASRSIGAEELGEKAESLEFAARDGNFDFIRQTNESFIEDTEKTAAGLSSLLAKIDAENPKPLKAAPDREALAALREAASAFDADGADSAMETLEAHRYESGAELVAWLREQIDMSEFTKIEERLTEELSRD